MSHFIDRYMYFRWYPFMEVFPSLHFQLDLYCSFILFLKIMPKNVKKKCTLITVNITVFLYQRTRMINEAPSCVRWVILSTKIVGVFEFVEFSKWWSDPRDTHSTCHRDVLGSLIQSFICFIDALGCIFL